MWVLIYAMCTWGEKACVTGDVNFDTKELCEYGIAVMKTDTPENMFQYEMYTCVPAKLLSK